MYITLQSHPDYDERIINVYSSCGNLLLTKTVIDTIDEYLDGLPETMQFKDLKNGIYLITEI